MDDTKRRDLTKGHSCFGHLPLRLCDFKVKLVFYTSTKLCTKSRIRQTAQKVFEGSYIVLIELLVFSSLVVEVERFIQSLILDHF